jgi:hypothetical protein
MTDSHAPLMLPQPTSTILSFSTILHPFGNAIEVNPYAIVAVLSGNFFL